VDSIRLKAMPVIRNTRHEKVAQVLACRGSAEEAARAAGYPDGTSFRANARRLSHHPAIRARVTELQETEAALVVVDVAWIKRKTAEVAGVDIAPDQVKASDKIAALNLLAKMTHGALVPSQSEMSGPDGLPVQVASLTRIIVDTPEDRDSESLPSPASAGAL
jgi:hypothetical protein